MGRIDFKIPFIGRAHKYTQEEVNEVIYAMKSAIPLTQGKYLDNFQKNSVSIPVLSSLLP